MNILILDKYNYNLDKHFKNENVYLNECENIKYDVVIKCEKNYIYVNNIKINNDEDLLFNINKKLAHQIIISRNKKIREKINNYTSSINDSYDKLKLIENIYKNYKAIILTCGPSINDYKDKILGLVDSSTLLICVKQTFNITEIADFYIPGDPIDIKFKYCVPVRIGVQALDRIFYDKKKNINLSDINFKNYGNVKRRYTLYDIEKNIDSLSWENNALTNKNHMMIHFAHAVHGVALPLCIHLGIKNIFIIGWDGHKNGAKNSHFYKNGIQDLTYYGSTAITKCNEYIVEFLFNNFNVNIYQINTKSLYDKIPKKTIDECIKFKL
jgi:hypothetical protein